MIRLIKLALLSMSLFAVVQAQELHMASQTSLWAEVYNASYTTPKTDGIIPLERATVNRAFDGPGTMDIESPITAYEFQARAYDLLTVKSVVEVWWQEGGQSPIRKGAFVVEKRQLVQDGTGYHLKASGADILSLLMNKSTSFARSYDNQSVQTVVSALLTLSGWTASYDGVSGNISTRFDGVNVLNAIQAIAKQKGYHLRLTDTFKQLEFGTFGDSNGYSLIKMQGDHPDVERNPLAIPIESIEMLDTSGEVVNLIYPTGAGDGDSFLTLAQATVSTAYTVQSETGPDGRTVYYLADSTSITNYGQIEARVNFKKIAPIGTSTTTIAYASDDLKVAASEWLTRHKDPLEQLKVHILKPNVNLQVGDKIYVDYFGQVNVNDSPATIKDIQGDYWIMGVSEQLGGSGESVTLDLSNIDRIMETDRDQIIVGQMDAIDVQEVGYQPTYNIWTMGPYEVFLGPDQTINLLLPSDVLTIENVTMILYSTENLYAISSVVGGVVNVYRGGFVASSGQFVQFDVSVDGTSVATGIGSDSAALTTTQIDITDEIIAAGDGGRGEHELLFEQSAGAGAITIQFLIRGTIGQGAN